MKQKITCIAMATIVFMFTACSPNKDESSTSLGESFGHKIEIGERVHGAGYADTEHMGPVWAFIVRVDGKDYICIQGGYRSGMAICPLPEPLPEAVSDTE